MGKRIITHHKCCHGQLLWFPFDNFRDTTGLSHLNNNFKTISQSYIKLTAGIRRILDWQREMKLFVTLKASL